MGSGSFPLCKSDCGWEALGRARFLIQGVIYEWYRDVADGASGGGQVDNAMLDGGYLERLAVAVEQLEVVAKGLTTWQDAESAGAADSGG